MLFKPVGKTQCDYGEVLEALGVIFEVPLFPIEVGEEVRIGRKDFTGSTNEALGEPWKATPASRANLSVLSSPTPFPSPVRHRVRSF